MSSASANPARSDQPWQQRLDIVVVGLGAAQLDGQRPERIGGDRVVGLLVAETGCPDERDPAIVLGGSGDGLVRRLCNQAFFTKITLTEHLDVTSEFTGVYEAILDPTNRLHAEFWQRTGQLHPDIDLNNEATLPTDHGGRVGTSTKWWS